MDRRAFVPIIAGIIIAVVCVWRVATNKEQDYADQVAAAVIKRAAPGFEARDADNHLLRLGAFLGRHKIIVLFFNGDAGPEVEDKELMRQRDLVRMRDLVLLRERYEELQSHNVKVVAISGGLPSQNRKAMERIGKFPFSLVADIDPLTPNDVLRIHRQWGRIDSQTGKPQTGVFFVDRTGQILFTVDGPKPLASVDEAIAAALK